MRSPPRFPTVLWTALLAALACGDGEPTADEPMQCWNVLRQVRFHLKADLDLLLLVGNASSMAEEQATLSYDVHYLVERLRSLVGGTPDLHAAAMSDDGARLLVPDACPSLSGGARFVSDLAIDPETGTREVNYTGDLGDQLACMAAVGTGGDEAERPLASLARALESEESGFRRPGVPLAIAIVTDGEDASPDQVSAYVDRVRARAPASAAVSVVSGGPQGCAVDGFTDAAPAPRLAAFAGAFGAAGSAVSLCGLDGLLVGLAGALEDIPVAACIGDEVPAPPDCRVSDVWHDGARGP